MNTVMSCLWKGDDLPGYSANQYDARDVLNLLRGVQRHVTDSRLVLLVDEHHLTVLNRNAELLHAARSFKFQAIPFCGYGIGGWSNVLEAFRPDLNRHRSDHERTLLVGLDTVFVRNSDWLFTWDKAPVGLPHDPAHPQTNPPCDAVISFTAAGARLVWDEFMATRDFVPFPHLYNGRPSEMVLLQQLWRQHGWPLLETVANQKLVSYKCQHVAQHGIPDEATIVYFHGKPKPRDLQASDPVYQHIH